MTDPTQPLPEPQSPPPSNLPPAPPPPAATPPRKKKRWWLRALLALVVLGLLVVALLPTLLSLSPVRSIAVGQAQAFIPHGKLVVDDYSLGWFSGIRASGVRLLDEQGKIVVEADEVKTNLTLLQAARQKFDLTGTVVDAAAHVVVDPAGRTNLQHVLGLDEPKPTPATKPHAEHKETEKEAKSPATKLPDVTADVTLKLHGDVTLVDASQAAVAVVRLQPGSGGTIRIPNINAPIDADLKLLYDTGDGTKTGTIGLKSTVDAIENNRIDLPNLAAKLDLPVSGVDFAGLKPFLAIAGLADLDLGGVASGDVAGELKPGETGGIKGAFTVADLSVSGRPASGATTQPAGLAAALVHLKDVYKASSVQMPIELSRAMVNGVSRLQLHVGVVLPETSLQIAGDLPEPALAKLSDTEMPGDTGTASVSLATDLKKLSAALPKTIAAYLPGVSVESGSVDTNVSLALRPADIQTHVKTDIAMRATRDGKPAEFEPITFTSDATVTDLKKPLPGLRDLAVSFSSAFASLQASGPTLATITGQGRADLDKAQQQAAQFVDLGKTQVAGQAKFDLASKSVAGDASARHATLSADVSKLHLSLENQPPIDLALATASADATLTMDDSGLYPTRVQTATAAVTAGAGADDLLLDTQLALADFDVAAMKIRHVTVGKLSVPSLPRLQTFAGPFVKALREQNIEVANGSINAAIDASDIDVSAKTFDLTRFEASLPKLRVRRGGKDLLSDTVRMMLAAKSSAANGVMKIDVSTLSVKSALATVEKGDGPLTVELQNNMPRGTGTVTLGLDAVQANRIARAATTRPNVAEVTAGRFDGKLSLTSAAGKDATAGLSGTLAGLTLANTPVKDESYTLDLNAAVSPAFDHVTAGLRLKGDFFSVVGRDISVKKPADGVPVQKLVENAVFDIGVKDLAKAQTVLSALVPGLNLPLSPAGALSMQAKLANGQANVDLQGSDLVVTNAAGRSFSFDPRKPVALKLAATVEGEKAIDGLRVSALSGEFDVAQIAMDEPIVVSGLSTTPKAAGKITLAGSFERLMPLLQVLQQADKPMPYGGRFSFTQTVGPKGAAIALKGTGTIDDFTLLDDSGKASFTEKRVTIANDLSADVAKQIATIASLTLDMASSKAAQVAVQGGVEDWSGERRLKNIVVKVDAVGEKAWPIVYAMMPPAQQTQFKDAKVTGPIKIDLTANGAYPVKPTWNESARSVIAYGDLSVKSIDTMGLSVADFALPFSLFDNGKLITGDARKKGAARFAKPFSINNGLGDFGSIVLDVGDPDLRLSIGRKQKLLQKVELNPVLASQLGSLASIVFKDAQDASGLIDLTVIECNNVRLLDLMNKQATASFTYNVHKLQLDGPVPSALSKALNWGGGGILGDIDSASLALKKGIAHQDMTIALQRQGQIKKGEVDDDGKAKTVTETMKFKGGVNLATNKFDNYTLTLSPGLLLRDWRKSFADGATVELKGRVDDVTGILAQAVAQLAAQGYGGDAVEKLLGGLKKSKKEK